jgi:hypothetical protein
MLRFQSAIASRIGESLGSYQEYTVNSEGNSGANEKLERFFIIHLVKLVNLAPGTAFTNFSRIILSFF